MEKLKDKIVRHLRDPKSYDYKTLKTGVGMMVDHVITRREGEGVIGLTGIEENLSGVPGLTRIALASYIPPLRRMVPVAHRSRSYRGSHEITIDGILFPHNAAIDIMVDPHANVPTSQLGMLEDSPLATFTGPTFVDGVPNNGFWSAYNPEIAMEFGHTASPDERRGAMAFREDGQLDLITDEEKWIYVSNGFRGLEALVGTSHYFSHSDSTDRTDLDERNGRNNLSYLVRYDTGQFGFFVCNRLVTRRTMKKAIDTSMRVNAAEGYMAVELEYTNAACAVHTPQETRQFGGEGFKNRVDHYIVDLLAARTV